MLSTLKSKKKNKKGFTLVELVIVIAIIAILAAIAIPTVSNVVDTANINTDKANAQTVELTLKSADAEIAAVHLQVLGAGEVRVHFGFEANQVQNGLMKIIEYTVKKKAEVKMS